MIVTYDWTPDCTHRARGSSTRRSSPPGCMTLDAVGRDGKRSRRGYWPILAEFNTGSVEGQGTAGAGSCGMTSFETALFSSGVTKSIGSMTVFFNTSTANCAKPVRPVAKDFIGKYVTSGSSMAPFTENIAVAKPFRSPANSLPNNGIVLRNCE